MWHGYQNQPHGPHYVFHRDPGYVGFNLPYFVVSVFLSHCQHLVALVHAVQARRRMPTLSVHSAGQYHTGPAPRVRRPTPRDTGSRATATGNEDGRVRQNVRARKNESRWPCEDPGSYDSLHTFSYITLNFNSEFICTSSCRWVRI